MSISVNVDPTAYPGARRARAVAMLREGEVPSNLLYEGPGQAARWLAYHGACSPVSTGKPLLDLYRRAFDAAITRVPDARSFVSLGCGSGHKDRLFFDRAAARSGRLPAYVPVDVALELLLEATQLCSTAFPALAVKPLLADLGAEPVAELLSEAPSILGCFGILPNFDHRTLLRYLFRLATPEGRVVLSANLSPEAYDSSRELIVPQYDNEPARRWYEGAALALGLDPSSTRIEVRSRSLSSDGGIWRIEAIAAVDRPIALHLFEQRLELDAGAELLLFRSQRFTVEALLELFRAAGFDCEEEAVAGDRQEGVFLLRRVDLRGANG